MSRRDRILRRCRDKLAGVKRGTAKSEKVAVAKPVVSEPVDSEFDKLWESTGGTPICPNCESIFCEGSIKDVKGGVAVVDWVCSCGHRWSGRGEFEDGYLNLIDELDELGMMVLDPVSGNDDDLPMCSVNGCGRRGRYVDPTVAPLDSKPLCRFHALNVRR